MSFVLRRMLKGLGVVQRHPVCIRRGISVAMPDGTQLLTDLYLGSPDTPAPAVLIRSPYGRTTFLAGSTAYPLASQGFNVVLQSCRGTAGSSGTFDPHHDEQRDGLGSIAWIRRQPWYGGSIATFGGSYLGYVQWALAEAAGPELRAMAMSVTLSDFAQMTYAGHSFALENALTWTKMMSMMNGKRRFALLRLVLSRLLGSMKITDAQWRSLPLGAMDESVIGTRVPFWQDWLQHSCAEDPWWAPMSFRKRIGSTNRPISMVAGWFDIFVPWQMQDFIALRRAGCESRITVGPWSHSDKQIIRASVHDAIDWLNRHLLDQPGEPRPKPVKLYVIGADEWRYFSEWPPRECIAERQYLQPERTLLDRMPVESEPDQYCYDPMNPTPSLGGPALEAIPYSVDNASLEARTDVLTYTSQAWPQHRDMIGTVSAQLYASSSAPSADFFVRLCDVDTQGVSRNICDGLCRVRFESNPSPKRVDIELWPTAYRIAAGHRVRVQISSGAFPRWARNLGGLEPIATQTQARTAIQSIHHSPSYPSCVTLPLLSD
jgi:putative CocE/NonD family hydrolase